MGMKKGMEGMALLGTFFVQYKHVAARTGVDVRVDRSCSVRLLRTEDVLLHLLLCIFYADFACVDLFLQDFDHLYRQMHVVFQDART